MKQLLFLIWVLTLVSNATSSCNKRNGSGCIEQNWYADADGDGLGDPNVSVFSCDPPQGYVANGNDPDDNSNSNEGETCPPKEIFIGPNAFTLIPVDLSVRGSCNQQLPYSPMVTMTTNGQNRVFSSNSIPNHKVGLFGMVQGSLNPNAISENNRSYSVPLNPGIANNITPLLNTNTGPAYDFGILLNGVLLDPEAAEPFPHEGMFSPNVNWEWNLDAMMIDLGLDCNNAHVQPSGKYHYHGAPTLYLQSMNITGKEMALVGYAADGFPIYYKYGYRVPDDPNSGIVALNSSYELKSGTRPGDGVTAPCGAYNGVYTNDWKFSVGRGDLDECNGRIGVTPEFPNGTYYYVITDGFPFLPRYLRGNPSSDFKKH
ncbi:MAG: YHYH protein [Saprospiraceae bacterium]|nr:YHYH protein [Saprospiraceae bacterium]MCB9343307.1 YHYH protein [Lewinellaceae bacterium]